MYTSSHEDTAAINCSTFNALKCTCSTYNTRLRAELISTHVSVYVCIVVHHENLSGASSMQALVQRPSAPTTYALDMLCSCTHTEDELELRIPFSGFNHVHALFNLVTTSSTLTVSPVCTYMCGYSLVTSTWQLELSGFTKRLNR